MNMRWLTGLFGKPAPVIEPPKAEPEPPPAVPEPLPEPPAPEPARARRPRVVSVECNRCGREVDAYRRYADDHTVCLICVGEIQ